MFALTQKKTVFLNIDETWLDAGEYTRRKWAPKGSTNSVPIVQIRPRISMITGLDTLGNIYLSLTQSNSNSKVMEIFFRQLVLKLNKDRLDWRENTIVILDNASYHSTSSVIKLLESLRIPVIFSGPHSYDTAVCELIFAMFKSGNWNKEGLPMGKK